MPSGATGDDDALRHVSAGFSGGNVIESTMRTAILDSSC